MDRKSGVDVGGVTVLVLWLSTILFGGILFLLYWLGKAIFNFLAWVFMFPGTKYSGDVPKRKRVVYETIEEEVEEPQNVQEENKTRLSPQEVAYILNQVTNGYNNPSQIDKNVKAILKEGEI
ncbi:MAG: hypothetical protein ACRCR5_08135 [Lactococcus garvieae]